MSKKLVRSLAIAAVFTGGFFVVDTVQEAQTAQAASSTKIDGYTYSAEVVEALNEINRIRKASGLQPYKINPSLTKSAESHAKYLVTHVKSTSHNQTTGKAGFTGVDFDARAKSAGYTVVSGGEAIAYGNLSVKNTIAELIEGIYHRKTILGSHYDTVGIGKNGNALVIVADNSDNNDGVQYMYPYNGQKDAPTLFDVKEKPDPLAKYGVKTSGYMLSFTPNVALSWFSDNIMTLKDSKGVNVAIFNKNNIADTDGNTLYIVPKAELKKGEKYTVNVTYYDIDEAKHTHSWSFTTAGTSTQPTTPTAPTTPVTPPLTDFSKYTKSFADFKANEWWASDMAWAIDRELITGYTGILNPKTKKYETQLKPYNQLTEAHFLMIMFRYLAPEEYKGTKATSKWTYNVPYKLAKKYNLPTLGDESSATKKNLAAQGIRRGKLAQILVSKHEGKQITETAAINFLMNNQISTAKTVEEFNANQVLTRAQVSAFLRRHEAFVLTNNRGH